MSDQMLSEEDLRDLRELSAEISGAMSLREPKCLMRAFGMPGARRLVLTMLGWAQLEALESPVIGGGALTFDQCREAAAVFGVPTEELDGDALALLAEEMDLAVKGAFAMALKMAPPGSTDDEAEDGFGSWLPVFACLVTQCGLSPTEARLEPVGCAFALIAGHRRNQGWKAKGTVYALRDLEESESHE